VGYAARLPRSLRWLDMARPVLWNEKGSRYELYKARPEVG
jgi:hypothetical protein